MITNQKAIFHKQTEMKLLTIFILSFIAFALSGTPIQCASSMNALEVPDLEVDLLSSNCPVESTCEFTCTNPKCGGKKVYFDLKSLPQNQWNTAVVQNAWKASCSAVSLSTWTENVVKQEFDKLPYSQKKHVDFYTSPQIKALQSYFSNFVKQYVEICKGGESLKVNKLNAVTKEFTDKYGIIYSGDTDYIRILAVDAYAQFLRNYVDKKFEFCSCQAFYNQLGDSAFKTQMQQKGEAACADKCGYANPPPAPQTKTTPTPAPQQTCKYTYSYATRRYENVCTPTPAPQKLTVVNPTPQRVSTPAPQQTCRYTYSYATRRYENVCTTTPAPQKLTVVNPTPQRVSTPAPQQTCKYTYSYATRRYENVCTTTPAPQKLTVVNPAPRRTCGYTYSYYTRRYVYSCRNTLESEDLEKKVNSLEEETRALEEEIEKSSE
jgi:hypothetical protein